MKHSLLTLLSVFHLFNAHSQGQWQWATSLDSTSISSSYLSDMAYDNLNNLVVTGAYSNTLAIGATTIGSNGGGDCYTASFKKNGALNWMVRGGGTENDISTGICTDNANNIYVVGTFSNAFVVGPAVLTHTANGEGIFLLKYDSSGGLIWAKKIGEGRVYPDLIKHKNGSLYFCGSFATTNAIPFSLGTNTFNASPFFRDVFLAKMDTSGNVQYASQFGGSGEDIAGGLCVTNAGDVILSGSYTSTLLPLGTFTLSHASNNKKSIFITKINSNGNVVWAKGINGVGYNTNYRVTTDASGNIGLAGSFVSPGFSVDNFSVTTSSINGSGLLIKFNSSGAALWTRTFAGNGGSPNENCFAASFDNQGDLYVTGSFKSQSLAIGNTTITNGGNYSKLFVAHYNSNGNNLGVLEAGGQLAFVESAAMLSDNSGNVHVGGSFGGDRVTFSPFSLAGQQNQVYNRFFVAQALVNSTGISEIASTGFVTIYPNPATSEIKIHSTLHAIETVSIFDLTGKVVASYHGFNQDFSIAIAHLPKGVYIVQLTTSNKDQIVRKLIKVE